jgi:hypothetical protein
MACHRQGNHAACHQGNNSLCAMSNEQQAKDLGLGTKSPIMSDRLVAIGCIFVCHMRKWDFALLFSHITHQLPLLPTSLC